METQLNREIKAKNILEEKLKDLEMKIVDFENEIEALRSEKRFKILIRLNFVFYIFKM